MIQSPIAIQEGVEVDAAGIWEEGRASYPGRSRLTSERATSLSGRSEKSAEAVLACLTSG